MILFTVAILSIYDINILLNQCEVSNSLEYFRSKEFYSFINSKRGTKTIAIYRKIRCVKVERL